MPASASGKPRATLELPAGLVAETPALWIPSQRTLCWRLRVEQPGDQTIGIRIGDRLYEKSFDGSRPIERRSPVRPGRSWLDQFVYPAERPLPSDGVLERVTVDLEPATVALPALGRVRVQSIRTVVVLPAWRRRSRAGPQALPPPGLSDVISARSLSKQALG